MDFSAFSDAAFWAALLSIIIANILLSGDNAVVIALASRNLPPAQQKKAIFWGSAAAIILRVVLTITAVALLTLPYLKIVGGLLLLYIGIQLLSDSGGEEHMEAKTSIWAAIRTILIADLVMSLDNVLAVAAAAQKGPDARRRPTAAREAYSLYVERAAEGAALPQMGLFQQPARPNDAASATPVVKSRAGCGILGMSAQPNKP